MQTLRHLKPISEKTPIVTQKLPEMREKGALERHRCAVQPRGISTYHA